MTQRHNAPSQRTSVDTEAPLSHLVDVNLRLAASAWIWKAVEVEESYASIPTLSEVLLSPKPAVQDGLCADADGCVAVNQPQIEVPKPSTATTCSPRRAPFGQARHKEALSINDRKSPGKRYGVACQARRTAVISLVNKLADRIHR